MKDFKTPVTYIKPQHPDYVRVTLKQSAASKPSIDLKLVKKQKPTQQAKHDVRRELYTHLLACRDCLVEHHVFCSAVSVVGGQYTDWLENTDHGKPIEEVKFEFIGHVVSGRIKKWKQLNELSQV